jgi:hypothetical protein
VTSISPASAEENLALDIGAFAHDPLGYVLYAFPWGIGELADERGPRTWQRELLHRLGEKLRDGELVGVADVIREATASGHGIGKSALVAWLILWALSTFEDVVRACQVASVDD